MSILSKGLRFIYGLFLFFHCKRVLDIQTVLKGKRVAIVGAASSAFNSGKGSYIDGFDVVIRINKAGLLLKDGKWKQDIGAKTDILFHSFFENEQSGGGPLDLALFDSLGIRYLVNPIAAYEGYRVTFNFYKKYVTNRITYSLSKNWYQALKKKLGKFRPTIGFCALSAALNSEFSELYITGFTFFKTPFGEGYRDAMKDTHQVQQHIRQAGLHDPDLEFRLFLDQLAANREKNIKMDDTLLAIVTENKK